VSLSRRHYLVAATGTADPSEQFFCVVTRNTADRSLPFSIDPVDAEPGSGVEGSIEVPAESTAVERRLVDAPGAYTVRIQIDDTGLAYSWDVLAEQVTGVRVVFEDGSVQAETGVTGPCTLDATSE